MCKPHFINIIRQLGWFYLKHCTVVGVQILQGSPFNFFCIYILGLHACWITIWQLLIFLGNTILFSIAVAPFHVLPIMQKHSVSVFYLTLIFWVGFFVCLFGVCWFIFLDGGVGDRHLIWISPSDCIFKVLWIIYKLHVSYRKIKRRGGGINLLMEASIEITLNTFIFIKCL